MKREAATFFNGLLVNTPYFVKINRGSVVFQLCGRTPSALSKTAGDVFLLCNVDEFSKATLKLVLNLLRALVHNCGAEVCPSTGVFLEKSMELYSGESRGEHDTERTQASELQLTKLSE